ncbi:SPOR domain-containing protein [Thioalkalivibrio sp. HK1]|uniref:SPOR domain-containing protein n=1 Tax=Thioalkalivibrio sp. HK1 TaxID=1469245 RepID=UPI000470A0A0|nr:SPOR domain-containing protein [Thioalkalivibrio sp. HK1]
MAGQGKGAVKRPRHIVGGGGTTLFLAGVAVGCVLTWSTQRPESIPNPLRASYQDRAGVDENAFPPSPTYEFYTVLPGGGADLPAQSESLVLALDGAQEDGDSSGDSNPDSDADSNADSNEDTGDDMADDASGDSVDDALDEEKIAAGESSEPDLSSSPDSLADSSPRDLKPTSPSEPAPDHRANASPGEEAPAVASSAAPVQGAPARKIEDLVSPPAAAPDLLEEATLASIPDPEDEAQAALPSRYVIQVGSFKEPSEVERAKASLILMGFRVMVQSMSIDGGAPWHRVRVGPYQSLSQTESARARLESEGFRTIVLEGRRG